MENIKLPDDIIIKIKDTDDILVANELYIGQTMENVLYPQITFKGYSVDIKTKRIKEPVSVVYDLKQNCYIDD